MGIQRWEPAQALRPASAACAGGPPPGAWQKRARQVIAFAQQQLWSPEGEAALSYLREERRLSEGTIRRFGLGWLPKEVWDDAGRWGWEDRQRVWLPEGILIPCEVEGVLWSLKIRRSEGLPRYVAVRGSQRALFGADSLPEASVAFLCEGELDAMLLMQEAGDLAGERLWAGPRSRSRRDGYGVCAGQGTSWSLTTGTGRASRRPGRSSLCPLA